LRLVARPGESSLWQGGRVLRLLYRSPDCCWVSPRPLPVSKPVADAISETASCCLKYRPAWS